MSEIHPHASYLKEFEIAIERLVPTLPAEIRSEAEELHRKLTEESTVAEGQIFDALVTVGKKEFPYRRAYDEMLGEQHEKELERQVLEHVEPNVKKVVEKYLKDGISVDEFVKSDMFEEELTPEERYQVTDGIFVAQDNIRKGAADEVQGQEVRYAELVEKWKGIQNEIHELLDGLREIAAENPKFEEGIMNKVHLFEEGWSVVERDPEIESVKSEIKYWAETVEESE